jgi:hypothetical protein
MMNHDSNRTYDSLFTKIALSPYRFPLVCLVLVVSFLILSPLKAQEESAGWPEWKKFDKSLFSG